MSESDFTFRFGGIRRLYGNAALERFRQSHVCVIGIGGVGSWAAEALARSGIGKITLIDMDDICVSNINRQIHAMDGHIGKPKTGAMAERINAINPECQVYTEMMFISEKNLDRITGNFNYVIDAIDSIKAKTALVAHCKRNKIPLVVAGGAGGQSDPTQIQIADLTRTRHDPLLAKVRSKLRKEYGFSKNPKRKFGIDCIFSTEQVKYPQPDGSVCQQKPVQDGPVRLDCASGFGAATTVTATFGLFSAAKVLNKLAAGAK
ncbi:MAG: tRNA cyclic N6-threonylcarbamoyladenosine(37) synthase TcdA [Proteobacteria bacterium]|nr:MAG: tRNA cyclic N6-threonylcarbamoyladenosine(37) synthase TcdA [Pseudomonadota bacterium]